MTAHCDDFDAYARDPETWDLAARRNWFAAELLLDQASRLGLSQSRDWKQYSGLLYAGYLHAGLAIENAAKRLLIGRTPSIVAGGQINKGAFGSRQHALVELANLTNCPFSAAELSLMKKLEQFVVWAGKYSAPLGAAATDSSAKLDVLRNSTANEVELIRSLVFRLLDEGV